MTEARAWAMSLAEAILADNPQLGVIALADRVHDAMVADNQLMDSSAELQSTCDAAARAAVKGA
jgi:hypothetical protein